jgi:hypothetical protein
MQEIAQAASYAMGMGAGSAMPMLCRMLAEKGILTQIEVEALRHVSLQGFDKLREQSAFPKELESQLEEVRQHAEMLWQRASKAAGQE